MTHLVTGCPPVPLQGGIKVCDACECTFGTAQCRNERERRMHEMDLKQIAAVWLAANGYDGLCNGDIFCGCGLDDLMPCDSSCATCRPAVRIECSEDCEYQGDWCDGPGDMASNGCWTTAVQPRRVG